MRAGGGCWSGALEELHLFVCLGAGGVGELAIVVLGAVDAGGDGVVLIVDLGGGGEDVLLGGLVAEPCLVVCGG